MTVRSLPEEAVPFLARWLSDPRVLEFYEGRDNPHDEARVRRVFFDEKEEYISPCLVEYGGTPIGYIQFYPIEPETRVEYGYPEDETIYGLDQFIGEPEYWNRGVGTQLVKLMVSYLFRERGAQRVVLDPETWNLRAIRVYEKCGFRKVKLLPEHEWHEGKMRDSWLMEVLPE